LGQNCVTVGYSIVGNPDLAIQDEYKWIDDIMKKVATKNNLIFQKDVKKLTVGEA
jgi:hypothetical protein